jgi:hypothetical protein
MIPFPAKYAGVCADCGGFFDAGEMIIMDLSNDGESKRYVHAVEGDHLDPAKLKPTKFEGTTLEDMGF